MKTQRKLTTEAFDPFPYAQDVREHPEKYVSMAEIARNVQDRLKIKRADTLDALKTAYTGPAKAARDSGDPELLAWLTGAKDARKKELQAAAEGIK